MLCNFELKITQKDAVNRKQSIFGKTFIESSIGVMTIVVLEFANSRYFNGRSMSVNMEHKTRDLSTKK